MTRLGDLLHFGQLLKAFGNNYLICPNLLHSWAIFVRMSKSLIFLVKSCLGKFFRHLATFTSHTVPYPWTSTATFFAHECLKGPALIMVTGAYLTAPASRKANPICMRKTMMPLMIRKKASVLTISAFILASISPNDVSFDATVVVVWMPTTSMSLSSAMS